MSGDASDPSRAGPGLFGGAGTLEEQAERLGVAIVGEFSRLALSSRAPIRLGERCTVFMEQDVNLRWIYVHIIEEYARHNGHADLLRERIDGATGA